MTAVRKHDPNRNVTFQQALDWVFDLTARLVARSLNLPAPLVHSAGLLAFAQVQAVETRAAKRFCAARATRAVLAWLRATFF